MNQNKTADNETTITQTKQLESKSQHNVKNPATL
jgi:hypothetical protein